MCYDLDRITVVILLHGKQAVALTMPGEISFELRAAIFAHHQNKLSSRKIVEKLTESGFVVSQSTVSRFIRKKCLELQGVSKPVKRLGNQNKRSVRTKQLIKKVKYLINRGDPFTLSQISKRVKTSKTTVRTIISQDLQGVRKKKSRTHALSDKMVAQRLEKGPEFLKLIWRKKWMNIVTVDEAWVYMTHVNGKRRVYYQFRGERSPESWTKIWKQKHPAGVMFVAGISSRGPTGIYFVPPRTKINAQSYIDLFLKPLFKKDVPRLFGKDAKNVVLHQDSAPAHVARKTYKWLADNRIKFIPNKKWPSNSPDLSPMDYAINGIFKRRLWLRKARGLQGLKRVMRDEWSKLSVSLCQRVLASWEKRVKMMLDNHGFQIEHLL